MSAKWRRIASPAGWPWASFTRLKWSRSARTRAKGAPACTAADSEAGEGIVRRRLARGVEFVPQLRDLAVGALQLGGEGGEAEGVVRRRLAQRAERIAHGGGAGEARQAGAGTVQPLDEFAFGGRPPLERVEHRAEFGAEQVAVAQQRLVARIEAARLLRGPGAGLRPGPGE